MDGSTDRAFSYDVGLAKTVLVAMADPQLRGLLCTQLARQGVLCVSAGSVADAGQLLQEFYPDALLLDIDGDRRPFADLLRQVCEAPVAIPSAMLASNVFKSCGHQREMCGADFCVPKPFHPGALIRTVIGLLDGKGAESLQAATAGKIRRGLLALDLNDNLVQVTIGGREEIVDVAPNDFRLLKYLMTEPDTNHERSKLLDTVWAGESIDERTVDASIMRLRKRLGTVRLERAIVTVQGKGYRFSTLFASTMSRTDTADQSQL